MGVHRVLGWAFRLGHLAPLRVGMGGPSVAAFVEEAHVSCQPQDSFCLLLLLEAGLGVEGAVLVTVEARAELLGVHDFTTLLS